MGMCDVGSQSAMETSVLTKELGNFLPRPNQHPRFSLFLLFLECVKLFSNT